MHAAHPDNLLDPRAEVRLEAAKALAHEDHPILHELCGSDDAALAILALEHGVRRAKAWHRAALSRAARHDDERVREVAVRLRARALGPETASDALGDESGRVRAAAVSILGRYNTGLLRDVVEGDADLIPRLAATELLTLEGTALEGEARRVQDEVRAIPKRERLALLEAAAASAPVLCYEPLFDYARDHDRRQLVEAARIAARLARLPQVGRRRRDPEGVVVCADRIFRLRSPLRWTAGQRIWSGLERGFRARPYPWPRALPWRALFLNERALDVNAAEEIGAWLARRARPTWFGSELEACRFGMNPAHHEAIAQALRPRWERRPWDEW